MASFLCIQNQPRDNDSRCIGSSHGWLIILDQQTHYNKLYLFNPNSRARIHLPVFHKTPMHKAVLSADPATTNDYVVVLIYGLASKVAYFNMDSTVQENWCSLDDEERVTDVICHNGLVLALEKECSYIGVWDVRDSLSAVKMNVIRPSFTSDDFGVWESKRDLCTWRWYVVEMAREIFVVCRIVGEYVLGGEPISDADLVDSETNHPLVCPYRTLGFQVYRLDSVRNEWAEVESIGANRVMFLGGNQSVSVLTSQVPGCVGNSIYFTDDYWDRMDEDCMYGGHDLGVYSLDDKRVNDLHQFDLLERIEPPPVWVLPPAVHAN